MFKQACVLAAALALATSETPLEKNSWALLVAGSKGWSNYRHQADVCHAYHVMINEGIPKNRIVVMMYDDIANSSANPQQGVIINEPNGTNVYAGVKIDYRGENVTSQNFLNILSGNKTAMKGIGTGRVINSNSKQNIFVYFSDHGSTGMLSFPKDELYADDLIDTLNAMRTKKKYKKMIIYVEACEAGSMFQSLLGEHKKIYVMTASASDEPSSAVYHDDDLGTFLGDEFSNAWMKNMDNATSGTKEALFAQYQKVRAFTQLSHVQLYGDFSFGENLLTPNKKNSTSVSSTTGLARKVNSRDVTLYLAEQARDQSNVAYIRQTRRMSDSLMTNLIGTATGQDAALHERVMTERNALTLNQFPCYKKLISAFKEQCFDTTNEYFLGHYYKFANLCALGVNTTSLLSDMSRVCQPLKGFAVREIM